MRRCEITSLTGLRSSSASFSTPRSSAPVEIHASTVSTLAKRVIAHHGVRSTSTSRDAGNNPGSSPAVARDWHRGVADFHPGTGHTAPTSDAGYTTASHSDPPELSITPSLREESIYGCY